MRAATETRAKAEGGREVPLALVPSAPPAPEKTRLESLDAFRGLTILGMLLVNNTALGDDTPATLVHAGWGQGIHFADLVFPWFLFIVGLAVPYSRGSAPPWRYRARALRRAFVLVLLGCFVDSSIYRSPYLGLGVLQLIGLAYLGTALLADLSPRARLLVASGLLAAHWAALRFLPVPDVGTWVLEEEHNLVVWLNREWLAALHVKGLLSVVPTTALALLGSCAGDLLRHPGWSGGRRSLALFGASALAATLGWLWSLDLLFSKALWTAPFVLATAGLGGMVLGTLHWLVDVRGLSALFLPLRVAGKNAIAAYVGPILVKVDVLQVWTLPTPSGARESLQDFALRSLREGYGPWIGGWTYMLGYLAACWAVLYWMYRRRIFWKV